MWRRWNNYGGNGGSSISHPTLLETTMEEAYLETIPEVDSVKSKRSSMTNTIPEMSYRAMPTMHHQYSEPDWSQPSPTIPDYHPPQNTRPYYGQSLDVSPPSSPPRSDPDVSSDVPVSPIEPDAAMRARGLPASHDLRSRIPQRITSGKSKLATDENNKGETRWDAYSGEPTKEETGLPATVRPGVAPLEHQYPQLKERTKQILAGLREREATNKPGWGKQPPPVAAADPLDHVMRKEPWRGASGRTTLVDPVQNNPAARNGPIHHPQRNISRMKQPDITEKADSPAYTLRTVASEESIKPIAPLKIPPKSRNTSSQSSDRSPSPPFYDTIQSAPPTYQHAKSLQSPFSSPGPVKAIDTTVPLAYTHPDSPPNDAVPATPPTPTPPSMSQETAPVKVQQMPSEPDISRFSWTTYTTSVVDSPSNLSRLIREESPPPMPPVSQLYITKRADAEVPEERSEMRRNARLSQASIVSRKPVGSKARPSTGSVSSQLSLSKTLPQIPPESTDKVANLEAQLKALAMRKHNISRIIHDLNESLKKNAIIYDVWKRKDVAQKIASHEAELQSVTSEAHEVELRLHRVQKKRDQNDFYEHPTGLWIRRVTS